MEKLAKQLGFESANEMHSLIADVDLTSQEAINAFKDWRENDGTKNGLLKL